MGCDIHFAVEKRVDGKWISVDEWEREDDWSSPRSEFYDGRNYNLFAILADVRNGRGFAGVRTGEGFNPISEPKGIPADASPEYRAWTEQWDGDGHSHSWHTVADLIAYDWTQVSKLQGWVDSVVFEHFTRFKGHVDRPRSYSGGVSGSSIAQVTNEEMQALVGPVVESLRGQGGSMDAWEQKIRETVTADGKRPYTLLEWEQSYSSAARNFLSETMPKLWRVGPPEDVRIVFFFDN